MLGPTTTGTAICCSGGVEGVEGVGNIDQPLKICESRSESSQVTQVRERLLIVLWRREAHASHVAAAAVPQHVTDTGE